MKKNPVRVSNTAFPKTVDHHQASVNSSGKNDSSRHLLCNHFLTVPEFERILEWVRLNVSLLRNSPACVETHQQSLRAMGEPAKRLGELPRWRQSPEFSKREKAALSLSEIISLQEQEELSIQTYRDARRHLNLDEILRLKQTVTCLHHQLDLQAKSKPPPGNS